MKTISITAVVAVLALPRLAAAQVPTIDVNGSVSSPAMAEPEAPPTDQGAPATGDAAGEDTGYYHTDDYDVGSAPADEGGVAAHNAAVPAVHVVRKGDTLWDICTMYFSNPWEWPRVWSYNPEITNPHWIYPGDQVRLYGAGQGPAVAVAAIAPPDGETPPAPAVSGFELRQLAFVDQDQLKFAAKIDGATDEKALLSRGDEIYLDYAAGHPPKVGARYAIYEPQQVVTHPKDGHKVGAYVKIVGELEVESVKKDRRARAVITDSVDVIERGRLVGPLKTEFKDVAATSSEVDLQGTIVAQLSGEELIGARQVVFLDKGSRDGLKTGNRMYVVRRGDAYEKIMGPRSNVGKDDRRFPARAIGEVLVVQAGRATSVAVITLSLQELGVGDHVVMQKDLGDQEQTTP